MTTAPELVKVTYFPAGPTARMLRLLPRTRRLRGIKPWRPHLFARALLGGRLSADGEVAARSLLHLLIATQYELRTAWEGVLADAGGCLCLLRKPSEEEFRRVWNTTLEPPYSFRWEAGRLTGRDGCGTKHVRFWEALSDARSSPSDDADGLELGHGGEDL